MIENIVGAPDFFFDSIDVRRNDSNVILIDLTTAKQGIRTQCRSSENIGGCDFQENH